MQPKVSVIICGFNEREEIFFRSLASVKAQDYPNMEVFVIDDSGKERFRALVEKKFSDFFYIPSSFHNNAKALNLGVSHSNGDYIAILDGDDEWIHPQKLTLQVNFLEKNRDYAVVATGIEIQYPDEKIVIPDLSGKKNIAKRLLLESPICHSSILFRSSSARQIVEKNSKRGIIGLYDPFLKRGKDLDVLLSFGTVGKIEILQKVCTRYHQNQIGKRWVSARANIYIVLKHHKEYPYWIRAFFIQIFRFATFFVLEKIFGYKRV
jgi:glycosyltransferase involved in cell wall biosynthesis